MNGLALEKKRGRNGSKKHTYPKFGAQNTHCAK
jgi:hypothetical protein